VIIVDRKFDGTRLWWLFQVFGKASGTVKLLDGGWDAWRAAQPMTQEASPPPKEPVSHGKRASGTVRCSQETLD
jgi:3-mercaptopyruvate sulfurtransferase SseA